MAVIQNNDEKGAIEAAHNYYRACIEAIENSSQEKRINELYNVYFCIKDAVESRKLILLCGNGGSASDASHLAAELVCRFEKNRRAVRAIALNTDMSIISAIGNDISFEEIYVRQVEALGSMGDLLIIFSTSGNSMNCLRAAIYAKSIGMTVILFTGDADGKIVMHSNYVIKARSTRTSHIQEVHRVDYHLICLWLEETLDAV